MKVDCNVIQDTLKGDDVNAIRIRFIEYLEDSTQYMLNEEWGCLFSYFRTFRNGFYCKEGGS